MIHDNFGSINPFIPTGYPPVWNFLPSLVVEAIA